MLILLAVFAENKCEIELFSFFPKLTFTKVKNQNFNLLKLFSSCKRKKRKKSKRKKKETKKNTAKQNESVCRLNEKIFSLFFFASENVVGKQFDEKSFLYNTGLFQIKQIIYKIIELEKKYKKSNFTIQSTKVLS